ncbi:hypothetical protein A4A49_16088 [Nicotiana attenuata]|uniref:Uncharacterized protein n=1 Tax=Nicotiana attenuata TaxID=49451 RepID=A0A1J6IPU3_NICAT|nr:hypothetical protein A4A49_16088 [Nicotiana attenuata]
MNNMKWRFKKAFVALSGEVNSPASQEGKLSAFCSKAKKQNNINIEDILIVDCESNIKLVKPMVNIDFARN